MANLVNESINELVNTNMDGDKVKDRVFISMIGYGGSSSLAVDDIRSNYLSEFADNPLRIEKIKKKVSDGAGGLIEIEEQMPIFIESYYDKKGVRNSGAGMEYCYKLITNFKKRQPDSEPIVFHITGGFPTDFENLLTQTNLIKNINGIIMNHLLYKTKMNDFPVTSNVFDKLFKDYLFYESSSYIPDYLMNGTSIKQNSKFVTSGISSIINIIYEIYPIDN
ncbi:hypothetical protein LNJ00_00790 [Tenacibaculum finnmarkense genomovar ulcerans]|nr:hypothetical protein [Tenacibaculum finnmarkense genomovar ulcerans]